MHRVFNVDTSGLNTPYTWIFSGFSRIFFSHHIREFSLFLRVFSQLVRVWNFSGSIFEFSGSSGSNCHAQFHPKQRQNSLGDILCPHTFEKGPFSFLFWLNDACTSNCTCPVLKLRGQSGRCGPTMQRKNGEIRPHKNTRSGAK